MKHCSLIALLVFGLSPLAEASLGAHYAAHEPLQVIANKVRFRPCWIVTQLSMCRSVLSPIRLSRTSTTRYRSALAPKKEDAKTLVSDS